jgi:hypothetical protein
VDFFYITDQELRISSHYEELFEKIKFSGLFSFHNANIYAKSQPLLPPFLSLCLFLHFKSVFLKKYFFFIIFSLFQINIFLVFSDHFNMLMLKIFFFF